MTEYTIPIELPPEIAAEWEPVRFGFAKRGEAYLHVDRVHMTVEPFLKNKAALIVRRRHVWPDWMLAIPGEKWVAVDCDSRACLYVGDKPYVAGSFWVSETGYLVLENVLLPAHDGKPWTECLWEVK